MTEGPVRARVAAHLPWRVAEVLEVVTETPRVCSLVLRVPDWPGHVAGQHVDVRLTAEDGYQAQRSYSIASPPESSQLTLTVERLDDGEVSPYLAGEARPGDSFELRGPIGGPFTWTAATPGPLQLLGGGSGVVPLMAMLRHRALHAQDRRGPARLLYSSRTLPLIIYRAELARLAGQDDLLKVDHVLTRETPPGWTGAHRRVDAAMLRELTFSPEQRPAIYVCGSNGFVESVANNLVALGHDPGQIRTERFGPT